MSKITIVIATIAVLGVIASFQFYSTKNQTTIVAADVTDEVLGSLFEHWKLAHGKIYENPELEEKKLKTFMDNYVFVVNWNADKTHTSQVELNSFADMTSEEFREHMSCLNTGIEYEAGPVIETNETAGINDPIETVGDLPITVNWVAKGAVTPIQNQGSCGSCYAFSAVAALEGVNFIFNGGNLQKYSEQQIVDCSGSFGNQGCDGGLMDYCFQYVAANGIELEATYPYTGAEGTCNYNKANVAFTNTGYSDVTPNNGTALQYATVNSPISVGIEADKSVFQLYKSGVITGTACGTQLNHGVTVVGYNIASSRAYWIVKNSWGSSWGQEGYVWIGMSPTGNGVCGINMDASYPTFSS